MLIATFRLFLIEISDPEAWMPTMKKHNSRSITNRTFEETTFIWNNNDDRNAPILSNKTQYLFCDSKFFKHRLRLKEG